MRRLTALDKLQLARQTLTQREVAELLGVSRKTVYRWMTQGQKIPKEFNPLISLVLKEHKEIVREAQNEGELVSLYKKQTPVLVRHHAKKDIATGKGVISPIESVDLTGLSQNLINTILGDIWTSYRRRDQPFSMSYVYSINLQQYKGAVRSRDSGIRQSGMIPGDVLRSFTYQWEHDTPAWFIYQAEELLADQYDYDGELLHAKFAPVKGAAQNRKEQLEKIAAKKKKAEQKRIEREAKEAMKAQRQRARETKRYHAREEARRKRKAGD